MTGFLDQLMTLPTVRSAYLSPDRRWLAFEWYRVHPFQDVFAVPSDGSAAPVALTSTNQVTRLVSWAPDSRAVLVSQDHDGDERASLFRVDLDQPGTLQPLTGDRPSYFLRGGDLTPDNRALVYAINYDVENDREIAPYWLYRHDLLSGARVPIAKPQKPAFTLPSLNLSGTHAIYSRKDRHPAGLQTWMVDIEGREDREILNFGDDVKVVARWLPDGERILVLSESAGSGKRGYNSLGVYHCATGRVDWLIDDPARNIERAWVSPEGYILVDELKMGAHHPSVILPDGTAHTFPRLPGNLRPLGRAADGGWIAMYYAAAQPNDLVRFSANAAAPADLHSLTGMWSRTGLDPSALAPAEGITWRSVDGLEIHGWLYRAPGNPKRAIISVHGGPTYHAENDFDAELQYYVSRGFNVLDVNYRGSTGYGLAFREAIKADGWGGREQADIATGAQALIERGLAEPGRVGVTGTSYGGYSSWYLITHYPPDVIAASIPICGMTDLVVDYNTTRPDLRPYSEEMLGGTPESAPQRYYERSPIHFVDRIRGKLMIVQGKQDPNVTPENARQVVARLEAANVPYELVEFEDEGHGIMKPANQAVLFKKMADFFAAALG